jgi:DNA-directed RNA polymerase specialized sigma24 family protein
VESSKANESTGGAAQPRKGAASPARAKPLQGKRLSEQTAAFYEGLWGSARAGCLSLLRRLGCSEAEAEEVFGDTYATVMERVDPIERGLHEAQMVNVMKVSCRRRLINLRCREGVLREVPEAVELIADSDGEGPDELAVRSEAIAIGEEAVLSLSPRDRLIFLLRYHRDLSPEEVRQCVPHLSEHGYRRAIQRANAKVLTSYRRIDSGKRCGEFDPAALETFIAGAAQGKEAEAIEAHLKHCRSCQRSCVEMRAYLHELTSSLALLAALGSLGVGGASALAHALGGLGELPSILARAGGSAQLHLRALMVRARGGVSATGGKSGIGQVVGVSGLKIAGVCAGVAATCVVAGVVPGIGGLSLSGNHQPAGGGLPVIRETSPTSDEAAGQVRRARALAARRRVARQRRSRIEQRDRNRARDRKRAEAAQLIHEEASEPGVETEAVAPAPPPEPVEPVAPPPPPSGGGTSGGGQGSEFGL